MENEKKEYREERFEYALYINNNLVCKRNFRINNYIEQSMHSADFKNCVNEICDMINDDLKSKSRVYTWYNYNPDDVTEEFVEPAIKPWECTLKFVITDNKEEVISKIWDGYGYPKAIREKIDLGNKTVRITNNDGRVFTFEKDKYFKENADRLTNDMYILKAMINDKPDVLNLITRKICENCSPRENSYQTPSDYTLSEVYGTTGDKKNTKKYLFSKNATYKKYVSDWAKAVSEKTKEYRKTLYY